MRERGVLARGARPHRVCTGGGNRGECVLPGAGAASAGAVAVAGPVALDAGQAVELAIGAGWLPCGRPGEGLTGKLDGEVGDAIAFLVGVRNMATHPVSVMRHELAPDFADATHMRATYEVCEGIMGAVFERLNAAIRTVPVGCGGSVPAR